MKITFLPTTTLGRWTIGLIISLVSFFLLATATVTLGHQTGGDTITANNYIAFPMLIAMGSGIAAFITGLIGILKYKERSVLVLLSTFVGFDVLFFVLGSLLFGE